MDSNCQGIQKMSLIYLKPFLATKYRISITSISILSYSDVHVKLLLTTDRLYGIINFDGDVKYIQ